MKKLVVVLCTLLVCSCTKELSSEQIFEINGLSYEVDSQAPFTGKVIDFHENGQLEKQEIYQDGALNGSRETYYANGQIEKKEFYKGGIEDGPWEFYYADGQVKKKESYKDGKPDGT